MKEVIFTGYYGMNNYGDDLFGLVSIYGAKTWWPKISPSILAPPIEGMDEQFAVPKFVPANKYASGGKIGKLLRMLFSVKGLLSGAKFVFSGGSLFASNRSRIMTLAKHISKFSGKKFSAIGVSVGPFDSRASEEAVIDFLRCFDFISVRDKASFKLLQSYHLDAHIVFGRDLAGIVPILTGPVKKYARKTKLLGYSPCNIGGEPETAQRIDDLFIAEVSKLSHVQVRVFTLNSHEVHGDYERSRYVSERLTAAGMAVEQVDYAQRGVINTWRDIAACDAMVSVRLHGGITAYLCKLPFILFEYHKKCTDFLNDIGQPDSIRVCTYNAALAAGDFAPKLQALLAGRLSPKLSPARYAEEAVTPFTTDVPWINATN